MTIKEKNVKNPLTDVFNATNCSMPLSEYIDQAITINGYVRFEDVDSKTGEIKEYIGLVCDNGRCASTGSPIFIKAFDTLLDTLADNDMDLKNGVSIIPIVQKSKSGKDFYNFTLA